MTVLGGTRTRRVTGRASNLIVRIQVEMVVDVSQLTLESIVDVACIALLGGSNQPHRPHARPSGSADDDMVVHRHFHVPPGLDQVAG